MSHRNLTKHLKLYHQRKCPIDVHIPVNDLMAWEMYPQYRDVYDKVKLAEYQNLIYGILPITPKSENFPVIIKPIINLYGMGAHQSILVKDITQFDQQYFNTGFWLEFISGDHYNFDLIVENGHIVWKTCWLGYNLEKKKHKKHRKPTENKLSIEIEYEHGYFDYWELKHDRPLPTIIEKFISEKLTDYTGCITVECIEDIMIEIHLRMGDLDQLLEPEIINNIIHLYTHGKILPDFDLSVVPKTIYLFPIWSNLNIKESFHRGEVNRICHKYKMTTYNINRGDRPIPDGKLIRAAILISKEYFPGRLAQYELQSYLSKWGYRY